MINNRISQLYVSIIILAIYKVIKMGVSYKRLWKLLIDKDMKKKDLQEQAQISNYTISKLNRGDNVNTDTLVKICTALDCTFDEIMEVIPDNQGGKNNENY